MQIVAVENHETPSNDSAIMKALLAGFIIGSILGCYFGYKIGRQALVNSYLSSKPISERRVVKGTVKKAYDVAKYNSTSAYVMFDAIIQKQNYNMDDTYKFVCTSQELPMNTSALEKLLNEQY